jgi:glycosyltransferase involved in cell wall biosynthesis
VSGRERPRYSIVLPVFNEEENVTPMSEAVFSAMDALGEPYEVVFVDDGSTDGSAGLIRGLSAARKEVRLIRFRKNFGQSAAISAGFDHARGDVVVTMDADLQNDPGDIPKMLALLDKGYDVVCGWRRDRQDRAFSRRLPSWIANWLIRRITGVTVNDYGCTLKVFRRDIIKNLPLYGGLHRFIPALAADYGARIAEVVVTHHGRKFGKSKYNIMRTFPVMIDLLFVSFMMRYSRRPLYFFGGIGLFLSAAGLAVLTWLAALKLFFGQSIGGRPLLIYGMIFLMGGIQLYSLGLLAGLLYKFQVESKEGATYSVLERIEGGAPVEKRD